MSEFRAEPGERLRDVQREGQSFLITKSGKPAAYLIPVPAGTGGPVIAGGLPIVLSEDTVIERDGTIRGPKPLTMGRDLG